MFETVESVSCDTQGSPLTPLNKGGTELLVPLVKGDLGDQQPLLPTKGLFKHPLSDRPTSNPLALRRHSL
jgi:hypothetical protein